MYSVDNILADLTPVNIGNGAHGFPEKIHGPGAGHIDQTGDTVPDGRTNAAPVHVGNGFSGRCENVQEPLSEFRKHLRNLLQRILDHWNKVRCQGFLDGCHQRRERFCYIGSCQDGNSKVFQAFTHDGQVILHGVCHLRIGIPHDIRFRAHRGQVFRESLDIGRDGQRRVTGFHRAEQIHHADAGFIRVFLEDSHNLPQVRPRSHHFLE